MDVSRLAYRLDSNDVIVWTSDGWDQFARDNGAPMLLSRSVVGTPIWAHMTGGVVHEVFRKLFEDIRTEGAVITLPFRCDAPDRMRLLKMRMGPGEGPAIDIETSLMKETARPPLRILEDPALHEANPEWLLRMCSWCKRVFMGEQWEELEPAVRELKLFEGAPLPLVTHGLCPVCYGRLIDQIRR